MAGLSPANACGFIELMAPVGADLLISGWLLHESGPFDEIEVEVDGKTVARAAPTRRPDVGNVLKKMPGSEACGFRFQLAAPPPRGRLTLRGIRGATRDSVYESLYRLDLDEVVTAPPDHLIKRVTGSTEVSFFRSAGLRTYTEFRDALERYHPERIGHLLDWGCGCGRMAVHLAADQVADEIHACDIDREAVEWCANNVPGAEFRPIDLYPPTSYADDYFDVVISYSVFTHLTEEAQHQWLRELKRIVAPGGLVLTTLNADYHARVWFGEEMSARLCREGFVDVGQDCNLDDVAPDDYYRGVLQSHWYTEKWADHFEIVDYVDGTQALVVLRR